MLKPFHEFETVIGPDPYLYSFIKGFYGGSRAIVDPPPTDTDCDIVLYVGSLVEFDNEISEEWVSPLADADRVYDGDSITFKTYRKGEYNLMVFDDPQEFGAVMAATCIAKHGNIKEKEKRYRLFEIARSPWR